MNIDVVKKSIRKWDQVRNTELGLTFLTSGSGFEVNKSEYNKWKNKDEKEEISYINLYIGVIEFEIVFYLVDDISDKNKIYTIDETLFIKNFTKENLEEEVLYKQPKEIEINDVEAAKRAFKWFLFSNKWAYYKLKDLKDNNNQDNNASGVVRVFKIPFNDFKKIFEEDENSYKAFLFFGLKEMNIKGKKYENEIEVILCSENGFLEQKNEVTEGEAGENENKLTKSEDVTSPHPPFSIADEAFNLL